MKTKSIKAYKVFNPDWTCKGFQYKVGETYEMSDSPRLCNKGFHACIKVSDCFSYYSFDPNNKVAEVLLMGEVVGLDGDKQASNKIKIVKEISWLDMLSLANAGIGNSGHSNSGDSNSGHSNSGDRNSGDRNSGYRNSGDSNSGDSNSGSFNVGHFNTTTPEVINVFNKPCNRSDWDSAEKPDFIYNLRLTEWIDWDSMTDDEKKADEHAFIRGGYLKKFGYKEAWKIAFDNKSDADLELLKALPNFDAVVFEEITGIKF